jgi:hypothetical protein
MQNKPRQEEWHTRRDRVARKIPVGLAISLGFIAVVILAWPYLQAALQWYLAPPSNRPLSITNRKDLVQGLASVAQALAVFLAGVVGLIGLYFTSRNLKQTREHTDRQLQQAEQGQITERFTNAIDQLGAIDEKRNARLEIRLGGIFALERIAVDSLTMENSPGRDYATIMEVLTAYVRENAPLPFRESTERPVGPNETAERSEDAEHQSGGAKQRLPSPSREKPTRENPRADIQAVLDVLGRRPEDLVPAEYRVQLDLREANLKGANLRGVNLRRANLRGAYLSGANLVEADLYKANLDEATLAEADLDGATLNEAHVFEANFYRANLSGASLIEANLYKANLVGARLRRANLHKADLTDANLQGANLEGANFQGANLQEAANLQFVYLGQGAELPEDFEMRKLWSLRHDKQTDNNNE